MFAEQTKVIPNQTKIPTLTKNILNANEFLLQLEREIRKVLREGSGKVVLILLELPIYNCNTEEVKELLRKSFRCYDLISQLQPNMFAIATIISKENAICAKELLDRVKERLNYKFNSGLKASIKIAPYEASTAAGLLKLAHQEISSYM